MRVAVDAERPPGCPDQARRPGPALKYQRTQLFLGYLQFVADPPRPSA